VVGTKEELHGLLDSLPESGLEEVRDLMIVLLREFEDLTEDDAKELREGEAEVERGEWVWWKDVQREDV
jgi:hypothetical protein